MEYPQTLPEPLLNHVYQSDGTFKVTQFEFGNRYRPKGNIIQPLVKLSFKVILDTNEYSDFRKFMSNLNNCMDWFEAQWNYDGLLQPGQSRQFHFESYPEFRKDQVSKLYHCTFTVTVKE